LVSSQTYSHYILRLEYKADPGPHQFRVVVRFRAADTLLGGQPCQAGLQVSEKPVSDPASTGSFFYGRDGRSVVPRNPPAELRPAGEWNRLEIEVNEQGLFAFVNGKAVQRTNLAELAGRPIAFAGLRQTWAPIALTGLNGTVRFRKIEIKQLPT